jgi:GTP-binding protein Era
VALIGRPNVGKSTLLNALVGEKVAIISSRPQTTRRRILGIRTTDAAQVVFVDTPGIHPPRTQLGRSMVKVARGAIPDADVVVWVVDVSRPPGPPDESIAGLIGQADRPVIVAMNKSDRLRPEDIAAHTDAYLGLLQPADWTLTIATAGHNLDRLWDMVVASLPEGPPLYPEDQLTDQTDRMLVAELIREAALGNLRDEVPHGVEVLVEEWDERRPELLHIAAKILVERESHKAIVVGRHGAMLKQIGTAARLAIEQLLETRVFLELFVSVRPGWRGRPSDLRRLGYP